MTTYRLLLLPGDGIGPEVMAEVQARHRLVQRPWPGSLRLSTRTWSAARAYDAHGKAISEDDDGARRWPPTRCCFGAVGGPKWDKVPYEVRPEAGLLRLRKDLQLFANLRPAICYPALADSSSLKRELVEGLDILIVRELTGGVYFGEPKEIIDLGNGQKRGIDTQVYDTFEIERIARVAFDLARNRREQGHLDGEAQRHEVGRALARGGDARCTGANIPTSTLDHMLADAGGMQLVRAPKQFDVIVTDNLFGDMLSDVAAMLTGSLGMLPSASLGAPDAQDRQAQGALRAGARLGAGHRRQGHRQPDRDARELRHGAALFVRHAAARPTSSRRRSRPCSTRAPHRRHLQRGQDRRSAPARWARRSSPRWTASRHDPRLREPRLLPPPEHLGQWFSWWSSSTASSSSGTPSPRRATRPAPCSASSSSAAASGGSTRCGPTAATWSPFSTPILPRAGVEITLWGAASRGSASRRRSTTSSSGASGSRRAPAASAATSST